MKLYHGSNSRVITLKSSIETGNIRKGEEGRRELRDVVFMTTSLGEARNYAGSLGFIYVVEVESPRQLCTIPLVQKEKIKKRSASIWVASSEKIKILSVICADGKIKKPFNKV